MSRIAKNPIKISKEIECNFNNGIFSAKGKLGQMKIKLIQIIISILTKMKLKLFLKMMTKRSRSKLGNY